MTTPRRILQAGMLATTLTGVFLLGRNVEAWCPFGGVEAIYTYAREGNLLCSLGISNFYVLAALLVTVLLVRRAFCGYLCPIGTISELLNVAAGRFGMRSLRISTWLDRALSLGKYVVLAAILVVTWHLGELAFRGYCPAYALLGRHGADITLWAYVVAVAILVISLGVTMPFCRWFCPLAAVMNPLSRFGLGRIKRDVAACCNCGRCAASCLMGIPVNRLHEVTESRCLACMQCMEACPSRQRPALSWGPPHRLGNASPQAVVFAVLLLCGGAAVAAAYWAPLPSFVRSRGMQPDHVASVELQIEGLTCRGRANLLVGFLERDDMHRIPGATLDTPGFYRLEAWPDPVTARVRIVYDPKRTNEEVIKLAIVEPYYDMNEDRWWQSPFVIEGYTPAGLEQ